MWKNEFLMLGIHRSNEVQTSFDVFNLDQHSMVHSAKNYATPRWSLCKIKFLYINHLDRR